MYIFKIAIYLSIIYMHSLIFLLKAQYQPFLFYSNFDIFGNRNMLHEVRYFLETDV